MYAAVTGEKFLYVRTCTPRYCISGTTSPIVLKVGMWVRQGRRHEVLTGGLIRHHNRPTSKIRFLLGFRPLNFENVAKYIFIFFMYFLPLHTGSVLHHLWEAPAPPAGLPVMRESPPHARLAQLGPILPTCHHVRTSPFRRCDVPMSPYGARMATSGVLEVVQCQSAIAEYADSDWLIASWQLIWQL